MLTGAERVCAVLLGLIAGGLAAFVELNPPKIAQASNSAACTTPKGGACTVSVSDNVTTIVVALIALAAAAALIALLGVRFTKLSAAGASLETDVTPASSADAKHATGKDLIATQTAVLEARTVEAARPGEAFQQLPDWAKRSLISWANNQTAVTKPIAFAVVDSAKDAGQGNKAWYVTVEQDSGEVMILRVATGRGGTRVGEHE